MKAVEILFIPCDKHGNFNQDKAIRDLLDHHNELVKQFNELLKSVRPYPPASSTGVAFPQDDDKTEYR